MLVGVPALRAAQFQVGLVDQRGRLQRRAGAHATAFAMGEPFQIVVEQRRQVVGQHANLRR